MREHTRPFSRRAFIGSAAALGISVCLPALTPHEAHAVTAAEKQAEANAALEKLSALQQKLDEASNTDWEACQERDAAQERMDEAQGRIDEASGRIGDLQDQLGTRARSMYRSGSASFIDLLLGATSFQAFASNWDLLNEMNQNDADMVQETKTLRSEVESEKAIYAEQRDIAASKAQEAEETKKKAEGLVAETQAVYDSLSEEAAQLLAEEEAAREAAALEAALRAEEEARRQAEEEERRQQQQQQNNGNNGGNNNSNNNGGNNKHKNNKNNGGGNDSIDEIESNNGGNNSSSNNSRPPTVSGNVVVDRAYAQLGKPYVWGAGGPDSFDCSGLVGYCLRGTPGHWCTTGTIAGWPKVTNPQPGDICIRSGHTGVYIGNGQMIHASTPKTGVIIGAVQSGMWYVRY